MSSATAAIEITTVSAGGLSFDCRTSGPMDGEPVLCLHGFPETSAFFNSLLEAGASAGFRMFAPDLRGISSGARPDPAVIANYHYDLIIGDVIALADALGLAKFHLVGHDHGCIVGWCVAARYPERLASYTGMSVPHPAALATALREDPEQVKASQYFHTFISAQGEALAAVAAAAGSGAFWDTPGLSEEIKDEFKAKFSQKDALRAAMNWYNGGFEAQLLPCPPVLPGSAFDGNAQFAKMVAGWVGSKPEGDVHTPVLLLWGSKDAALLRSGIDGSARHCKGEYKLVVVDCGHWMLLEAAEECVRETLGFLQQHKIVSAPQRKSSL